MKITLYKEFLATLPAGVCKLELGFEDGGVQTGGETEFKLLEEVKPKPEDPKPDDPKPEDPKPEDPKPDDSKPTPDTTPAPKPENPSDVPPTGDNSPVGLLLALTALSGSTLLIIYGVSRKKKRIGKFHKES